MLLFEELEQPILFEPALKDGLACDQLNIVTGFTDCERISSHLIALYDGINEKLKIYQKNIKIEIILGMTKGSSLTRRKHEKLRSTIARLNSQRGMPKIACRYVTEGKQVHSKVYVWSRRKTPCVAYCGSANYSMNAFRMRRECMSKCDPEQALNYYHFLLADTADCLDPMIEEKIHFSDRQGASEDIDNDNIENLNYEDYVEKEPLDTLTVSLLTRKGGVGFGSGINWGIRQNGTKRNRNQAYIPYNKPDRKDGFFPDKINPDDINFPLFKVVTRETGSFYMRRAQASGKGLHSAENNAILGKWLRDKLGVADGEFITKEMLENYGTTTVQFKKYENNIYVLEFEPSQST